MRLTPRIVLLAALAAATVAALPLLVGTGAVRAAGASTTATMAGLQTSRKTPVEVVVFNTTGSELTLDLRIIDTDGNTVLERPGGVVVGSLETAVVSLDAELSRDLRKKQKPFEGIVAVELAGDAPFAEFNAIVHATQYFGKRRRPRGAVVFRPVFKTTE